MVKSCNFDFEYSIIFDADNTLYEVEPKKAYKVQNSYICNLLNISIDLFEKQYQQAIEKIKKEKSLIKRNRTYSISKTINLILKKKQIKLDNKIIKNISKKALDLFYIELLESGIKYNENTILLMEKLRQKYNLFIASDEFEEPLKKKLNLVLINLSKY